MNEPTEPTRPDKLSDWIEKSIAGRGGYVNAILQDHRAALAEIARLREVAAFLTRELSKRASESVQRESEIARLEAEVMAMKREVKP